MESFGEEPGPRELQVRKEKGKGLALAQKEVRLVSPFNPYSKKQLSGKANTK